MSHSCYNMACGLPDNSARPYYSPPPARAAVVDVMVDPHPTGTGDPQQSDMYYVCYAASTYFGQTYWPAAYRQITGQSPNGMMTEISGDDYNTAIQKLASGPDSDYGVTLTSLAGSTFVPLTGTCDEAYWDNGPVANIGCAFDAGAATEPAESFSTQLDKLLIAHEGWSEKVYNDTAGNPTVGVGCNLNKAGAKAEIAGLTPAVDFDKLLKGQQTLTKDQINSLLHTDEGTATAQAETDIAGFDALPDQVRLVIIDMEFNLGSLSSWTNFKAAIAKGDYATAANEMENSKWYKQVPNRAKDDVAIMRSAAATQPSK